MDKKNDKKTASGRVLPRNTKIEVPSTDVLSDKIRKALKAQGTYSAGLEFAVTVAAGNYHAYLKCQASMCKRAKVMYPVTTREGSKAYKLYPDVEHLPAIARALKDSLKSLGLTLDTIELTDDDPLETLTGKVNDALNNG